MEKLANHNSSPVQAEYVSSVKGSEVTFVVSEDDLRALGMGVANWDGDEIVAHLNGVIDLK